MIIKPVFRVNRFSNEKFFKFNLCRIIYSKRKKAIKFALHPRIFRYENELTKGWNITILGVRITYERSWGGLLC
jgi:hypothetical protein